MTPEFQLPFPRNGRSAPLPPTSPEQTQTSLSKLDAQPTWTPKPTNTGHFGRRQPPPDEGPVPAAPVRR